jgi:hypothetical protein
MLAMFVPPAIRAGLPGELEDEVQVLAARPSEKAAGVPSGPTKAACLYFVKGGDGAGGEDPQARGATTPAFRQDEARR